MAALVGVIAFVAGLAVGAALAAWWLRRKQPATGPATATAAPRAAPPATALADGDQDLKPVLEATRGVVSELEQRYQGARAAQAPTRPRRRQPRSRG